MGLGAGTGGAGSISAESIAGRYGPVAGGGGVGGRAGAGCDFVWSGLAERERAEGSGEPLPLGSGVPGLGAGGSVAGSLVAVALVVVALVAVALGRWDQRGVREPSSGDPADLDGWGEPPLGDGLAGAGRAATASRPDQPVSAGGRTAAKVP